MIILAQAPKCNHPGHRPYRSNCAKTKSSEQRWLSRQGP